MSAARLNAAPAPWPPQDDTLSMQETAGRCGLSRERFRKVWKAWVRDLGFPAPFLSPRFVAVKGERRRIGPNYQWRAIDVDDWKARRQAASAPWSPPDDSRRPAGAAASPRLARERAELYRLMRSA